MDDQIGTSPSPSTLNEPFSFLLSREELLATLESLSAAFIPGIDPDPLGDLTADGRELAITVARRALQARELARVENGQLLLTRGLLTAVGACAYAERAVVAYHWPVGSTEPAAFFGHRRGADVVVHSRPVDVLHRFTVLPSPAALIDRLLDFCDYTCGASEPVEFKVDAQAFLRTRELADQERVAEAGAALCEAGVTPAASAALAQALAEHPAVSALRVVKQQQDGYVTSWDFSLLQGETQGWWVSRAAEAPNGTLTLGSMTKDQLAGRLAEWL